MMQYVWFRSIGCRPDSCIHCKGIGKRGIVKTVLVILKEILLFAASALLNNFKNKLKPVVLY